MVLYDVKLTFSDGWTLDLVHKQERNTWVMKKGNEPIYSKMMCTVKYRQIHYTNWWYLIPTCGSESRAAHAIQKLEEECEN